MKTVKTVAILALAFGLTLGSLSQAQAFQLIEQPIGQQPVPNRHHRHHGDSGAVFGAMAGGTLLGLVIGSTAAQAQQPAQPQVVVIQQPSDDATPVQHSLELEIERERLKRIALEQELERLRAESR
jgi:hypothetical protein